MQFSHKLGFVFALLLLLAQISFAQKFIRKPYLQKLGPRSVVMKMRLDVPENVQILYGLDKNKLEYKKKSSASALDHDLQIDSLLPNTSYYYAIQIGNSPAVLDTNWQFKTAPKIGSKSKFSFWSIGDMYPGPQQAEVYEGFKKFRKDKFTNLFLTVGDNVYCGGTEECFQTNFFDVYQNGYILQQAGFFPSTGNHDYDGFNKEADNPNLAYFNSFILPSNGELGGLPSNSEAYYSYDYGNVHFVVLESFANGKDGKRLFEANNIQLNWLKDDLAKNKQDWTIVYFHYPLYTKGSYDSDSNPDLIKLRETLAPIFDQFKVDVVLTGHSHTMERSKPTLKQYGLSSTFDPAVHQPQSSSGAFDNSPNSCPYFFDETKPNKSGVVYVTNGASGATSRPNGFGKHPIMYFDKKDKVGSFFGEVDGNKFVGKFIDQDGLVMDQFTIFKTKDGTCANCFNTQPKSGCGPSGKPNLLLNPLSNYCKGQSVDLQATGDETSSLKWYDALGNISTGNTFKLANLTFGKTNIQVSQVVNDIESEKLTIPIFAHESPILQNFQVPNELFPYVSKTINLAVNDSIQQYTWTLPKDWEGSSKTNSITFKPSQNGGEIKVFGISPYGCVSNEVIQKVQIAKVLGLTELANSVRIFPNPVQGDQVTIEVPSEFIGSQGQWVNFQGQILSTHKIQNKLQQHLVPYQASGMLFYQVNYPGGILSTKVIR